LGSFPLIKDPAHMGGYTAEVLAGCEGEAFAKWMPGGPAA